MSIRSALSKLEQKVQEQINPWRIKVYRQWSERPFTEVQLRELAEAKTRGTLRVISRANTDYDS